MADQSEHDRQDLYEAAGKAAKRSRAWHPDGRAEQLARDVVDLVLDHIDGEGGGGR